MNKDATSRGFSPRPTSTIAQFCADHNISRTHLHNMQKAGKGPRLMRLGRRVLISAEAAADWRARLERDTETEHFNPAELVVL